MTDVVQEANYKGIFLLYCSGCKETHVIWIKDNAAGYKGGWGFNGDFVKPTFTPSLLVKWNRNDEKGARVCHSFIRNGEIQFLNDCTHELAGQTVSLKAVQDWED